LATLRRPPLCQIAERGCFLADRKLVKPARSVHRVAARCDDALALAFKDLARKSGFKIYELAVKKVRPKASIRLKCQVPLCEYYGVCRVCPPHIPGVDDFKKALRDYRKAFLVVLKEKIENIEKYRTDFTAEIKLADFVSALELAAFRQGCYKVLGLTVGGCKLCPQCAPHDEPCRHPFKARPSPEGFGIDITELAREAGVPVEWPPVQYVNFMGLILF
jgi:predicted metal-binding protein